MLAHIEGERVALVGHEPHSAGCSAFLTTGGEIARGERFPLKKGGMALLSGSLRPGPMELQALVLPKMLRKLGA